MHITDTVFVDVCFLDVLPQIGSVMNVAEDMVANLPMGPASFFSCPVPVFCCFKQGNQKNSKLH